MTDWTQPDPDALQHWRELAVDLGHIVCTVGDCNEPHTARGMCRDHYDEWRRPNLTQYRALRIVEHERKLHGAVPIEDVEWLLECHPTMTAHQMAPRFNVKPESVRRAASRAGRTDLLDRLARNAELAGHNVTSRRTA